MRNAVLALVAFVPLLRATSVRADDPARPADFFFKDGDAVVVVGDSFTERLGI